MFLFQIQTPSMQSVLEMLNVINGIVFVQIRSVMLMFSSFRFNKKVVSCAFFQHPQLASWLRSFMKLTFTKYFSSTK